MCFTNAARIARLRDSGRMPFFETAMGAMAGYGLKTYLACQSLNHITHAATISYSTIAIW